MTLQKAYRDCMNVVEKGLHYKFWDKERERSNRAARLADDARGGIRTEARCFTIPVHDRVAWIGPPHDPIQAWVCLSCKGVACEPEIKDRGYDFKEVPDWIITEIMDLDLKRQVAGNPKSFGMSTK